MNPLNAEALAAAVVAWCESASDYRRLKLSIEAAIRAYLSAVPPPEAAPSSTRPKFGSPEYRDYINQHGREPGPEDWQTRALTAEASIATLTAERDEAQRQIAAYRKDASDYLDAVVLERTRAEAAEAKLARMREALERISSPTQTTNLLWWQVVAREALDFDRRARTEMENT